MVLVLLLLLGRAVGVHKTPNPRVRCQGRRDCAQPLALASGPLPATLGAGCRRQGGPTIRVPGLATPRVAVHGLSVAVAVERSGYWLGTKLAASGVCRWLSSILYS
jgi:hypothetical protein